MEENIQNCRAFLGGVRKDYIDAMRGLGILLVVLGHSIGDIYDPVNKIILSFHMPLFFFISGMVARNYIDNIGKQVKKLCFRYLIPQLTLCFVDTVFDIIVKKNELSIDLIIGNLFNWFLIVLFFVSAIFYLLVYERWMKTNKQKVRWLLISLATAVVIYWTNIQTFYHIEIVPTALIFFILGNIFINQEEGYLRHTKKNFLFNALEICSLPIIVSIIYWNEPVCMYNNQYGNLLLFFPVAILGILCIYEIGMRFQDNVYLRWLGLNSIIIYIFHDKILNVAHGIGKIIIPAISNNNYSYPEYVYYFLITMITLVPVVALCRRKSIAGLFGIHYRR